MAMTTKMMLVAIVFYGLIFAAIVAVIVWAVKYLIRSPPVTSPKAMPAMSSTSFLTLLPRPNWSLPRSAAA